MGGRRPRLSRDHRSGFSHFFMLYGPNTNLVINGSILVMVECQVRYVVEAIGGLRATRRRTMSLRRDVHERYGLEMEQGNARMVWGVADVPRWYRNARGQGDAELALGSASRTGARTWEPDLADYELPDQAGTAPKTVTGSSRREHGQLGQVGIVQPHAAMGDGRSRRSDQGVGVGRVIGPCMAMMASPEFCQSEMVSEWSEVTSTNGPYPGFGAGTFMVTKKVPVGVGSSGLPTPAGKLRISLPAS